MARARRLRRALVVLAAVAAIAGAGIAGDRALAQDGGSAAEPQPKLSFVGESTTVYLRGETATEADLGLDVPAQTGDVRQTWADVSAASELLGYDPKVPIAEGIARFVAWLEEQP